MQVINGYTTHVSDYKMDDDLFKDQPLWFRIGWVFAWGISIGLSIIIVWSIIQIVLMLIG